MSRSGARIAVCVAAGRTRSSCHRGAPVCLSTVLDYLQPTPTVKRGFPFSGKNATGRQLGRIAAVDYREVLLSYLFPGVQTSAPALPPLIDEFERIMPFSFCNRQHILLRMDAGFGTDSNLTWLLPHGYQIVVKGFSAARAAAHARCITTCRSSSNSRSARAIAAIGSSRV